VNPFANYKPEVPTGFNLTPGEEPMNEFEEKGLNELSKVGFVLIAGGLGERLGYSGIKIDLPVCTIEDDYCYLKYYIHYIHASRERALLHDPSLDKDTFYVPLCIMVSDDTEARTLKLLETFDYFCMKKEWVDIVK
jgi:UDP-sugar pyrophosphorylase